MPGSRARGFTLVEILVVVVIIAVIAAGAVLSLSALGQDRQLDTESDRLTALLNYAREQAELQSRELGLSCTEQGYEFLAFDPRQELWANIPEDDALRPRQLPQGLRLRLTVETVDIVLNKPDEKKSGLKDEDLKKRQPQVMIFSNGDLTSFELTLMRDGTDRKITLRPDDQGRIGVPQPKEKKT